MYILIPVIITLSLIVFGYFWSKGKAKIPFRSTKAKNNSEDWALTDHKWEISTKRGIYYCNVCSKLIGGWLGARMEECQICGAMSHFYCKGHKITCKQKTLSANQKFNTHQWLDGNLPVNSVCNVCKVTCGSIYGLDGSTCLWCQKVVHAECKQKLEEICDFGKLAKYIIQPSEVKNNKRGSSKFFKRKDSYQNMKDASKEVPKKETNDITISLNDEDKVPIIAIVNKISGGQVGADILQSFYRYLNPIQVIDLLDEGLEKLKLFKNLKKIKIIVGGGDGTIGSILTHISEPKFIEDFKVKASLGVLPLGTGNDLSQSLGWGITFTSQDVMSILRTVGNTANEILLDQWNVSINENNVEKSWKMYNYMGIGLDAKVAMTFHQMRKKYPYLFKSRVGNKFFYTQIGTNQFFLGKKINLAKSLQVYCDEKLINLDDFECIVFQNITHWGGGIKLWENSYSKNPNNVSDFMSDSTVTNEDNRSEHGNGNGIVQDKFKDATYCDGLIEAVGFTSMLHMGQVQASLASGIRVCQGSKLKIVLKKGNSMPMQIDGEPFELNGPATVSISLSKKVNVLVKAQDGKTPVETKILKVLNWAEEKNHINHEQKQILLHQFFNNAPDS